jgi:hypothetical protein
MSNMATSDSLQVAIKLLQSLKESLFLLEKKHYADTVLVSS